MVRHELGGEGRGDLVKWILAGRPDINAVVSDWVRRKVGLEHGWPQCSTLSLWDDVTILAAVVYEGYVGNNVCMHVAAEGKHWLNRQFLYAAFDYPFNQLKVDRVTGCVPDSNEAAKRFDEHLGFKREGLLRRASQDGTDLIVYGMLREECRFLERKLGRLSQTVTAGTA